MCWITYKVEMTKPKIAEKDIKVKKLLERTGTRVGLKSPFYKYSWKIGVVHRNNLQEPKLFRLFHPVISEHWEITDGLHSCKHLCKTRRWVYYSSTWFWFPLSKINVLTNYHDGLEIHKAIIPKGAHYYENEFGEYVSDKLIIL